jgi:hypothetical protein
MGASRPPVATLWERNIMNRIATAVAGLSLAFVGTSTTFAATINVPGDYALIQDAIDASVNGDVINIAAGTYNEHSLNPGGKAITIQGTLNGDGSLATTIDAQQAGIVFEVNSGEDYDTRIQSLIITGSGDHDSGIECTNFSKVSISGCIITANQRHGVYAYYGFPNVTDCLITNNTGSGIFLIGYTSESVFPTISNCVISGNTSGFGAGIFIDNLSPIVTDCVIADNVGPTQSSIGAGIYLASNENAVISGCTITGNSSNRNGGGLYIANSVNTTIANTQFLDNDADDFGGALFINNTEMTMTNCTIKNNSAWNGGGGLYVETSSTIVLTGCSICNNSGWAQVLETEEALGSTTSNLSFVNRECEGNVLDVVSQQQEQINQLLAMNAELMDLHVQQQTAIEDLQQVITECCAGALCAGDENGDGEVDVLDLLLVIAAWGPCP